MHLWSTLLSSPYSFFHSLLISQAQVPADQTFRHVNEIEFGDYVVGYGAYYCLLFGTFSSPFNIGFYNTTSSSFSLATRMGNATYGITLSLGLGGQTWKPKWRKCHPHVWDGWQPYWPILMAEWLGKPTLPSKAQWAWSCSRRGNMVLYDSKRNFVWQRFDYPTYTLLVGQSLRVGGVNTEIEF